MSLSISITEFVNEQNTELLAKSVLEPRSLSEFTQYDNVKYKEAIKFLETDVLFQAPTCGTLVNSGTTSISDKDIEVFTLQVAEFICPEDLTKYSTNLGQKPGVAEDVYFAEQYVNLKVQKIQNALEALAWNTQATGSTTAPAGLLYYFGVDSDVEDRTFAWSGTTYDDDDYINEVYGMYNAIPQTAKEKDDLTLYVPFVISQRMIQQFIIGDKYNLNYTDKSGNSPWMFPGNQIRVFPTQMKANNAVMTWTKNLIQGSDIMNEEEVFDFWWEKSKQTNIFLTKFRVGWNYFFGEDVCWSR